MKYLLIEFDDAADADKMHDIVDDNRGMTHRVVGVYIGPQPDSCRCNNWVTDGVKQAGPRYRDDRTGLTLCLTCMKDLPSQWLKNLLDPKDIENPHIFPVNKPGNLPQLRGRQAGGLSLNTRDAAFYTRKKDS